MQKICKLIIILLICTFSCLINCHATTDEITLQSYTKFRHKYTFGNMTHNLYFSKQKLKSNNYQIYNFHMPYNKEFEVYDINEEIPETSISKNIFYKIREIVYYGDMKYRETQNELYYLATNGLIVKALNPKDYNYLVSSNYTLEDVLEIEEALTKEMTNYFMKPSFNNKEIELNLNEEIILTDKNNILSTYLLEENLNDVVSYEVKDNKIVLKALKPGEVTFKLKKEYKDKDSNMKFLFAEVKGTPLTPINFAITSGNFTDYSLFKVKVNTSRIGLDIKDDKDLSNAKTLNVTYGIYNQKNDLIYQINTLVEGLFYTDYLPYGKYYIKEIRNSEVYLKNDNIYEVNLDNNQDKIIVIENFKRKDALNELNESKNLREIKISLLDEEGKLIKDNINISIMDKLYQINGNTSIFLKDGNYLMKFLKIPEDYLLEEENKILNVKDNMKITIILKHKEVGYGNEVINIDVPNTWSFNSINYLFIFVGLRYVKKFSKW